MEKKLGKYRKFQKSESMYKRIFNDCMAKIWYATSMKQHTSLTLNVFMLMHLCWLCVMFFIVISFKNTCIHWLECFFWEFSRFFYFLVFSRALNIYYIFSMFLEFSIFLELNTFLHWLEIFSRALKILFGFGVCQSIFRFVFWIFKSLEIFFVIVLPKCLWIFFKK